MDKTIARCAPAPLTKFETSPAPINSNAAWQNIGIDINKQPILVQSILICQNAEAGYIPGDEVMAFGIGTRANPAPNIAIEAGGLNLYLMVGTEKYWVSHKSTGISTTITDENWRILFRVYC